MKLNHNTHSKHKKETDEKNKSPLNTSSGVRTRRGEAKSNSGSDAKLQETSQPVAATAPTSLGTRS